MMKIAFTDICKTGNHYDITDGAWFAEQEIQLSGPVQAGVVLNRKGDSRVEAQGHLRTRVQLACDRCLADYNFAVDVKFHLVLEVPAEESWRVKELECSGVDLDTVQLSEPVVDLWDILRQQLYLSLPEKLLCSRECKGVCPACGIDLNSADCSCEREVGDSPFAVLAALARK